MFWSGTVGEDRVSKTGRDLHGKTFSLFWKRRPSKTHTSGHKGRALGPGVVKLQRQSNTQSGRLSSPLVFSEVNHPLLHYDGKGVLVPGPPPPPHLPSTSGRPSPKECNWQSPSFLLMTFRDLSRSVEKVFLETQEFVNRRGASFYRHNATTDALRPDTAPPSQQPHEPRTAPWVYYLRELSPLVP